jgi:hypothetical protein
MFYIPPSRVLQAAFGIQDWLRNGLFAAAITRATGRPFRLRFVTQVKSDSSPPSYSGASRKGGLTATARDALSAVSDIKSTNDSSTADSKEKEAWIP